MATMATETDAAASLMALGRSSPEAEDAIMADGNQNTDMTAGHVTNVDRSATASMDNTMQVDPINPPLAPPSASLSSSASSSASRPASKKKAAPKKARGGSSNSSSTKYTVKPKDPKRDQSVNFDEMKRLMRVYGSLKCLRKRTSVDSGKAAKPESIKRKFYRWFPDLEERFERTPEGWYQPKVGHEEEMRHRESMRKVDQESLVQKRNTKRSSSKKGVGV